MALEELRQVSYLNLTVPILSVDSGMTVNGEIQPVCRHIASKFFEFLKFRSSKLFSFPFCYLQKFIYNTCFFFIPDY